MHRKESGFISADMHVYGLALHFFVNRRRIDHTDAWRREKAFGFAAADRIALGKEATTLGWVLCVAEKHEKDKCNETVGLHEDFV